MKPYTDEELSFGKKMYAIDKFEKALDDLCLDAEKKGVSYEHIGFQLIFRGTEKLINQAGLKGAMHTLLCAVNTAIAKQK